MLRSSYGSHYRKMLPPVLETLRFRCNNTAHRPLMEALELLRRYAHRERIQFYDPAERVPIDGVVKPQWREAVVDERGRVERIPYELSVLISLREAIRRREIWIEGSRRWGDPETDLPQDFEQQNNTASATTRRSDSRLTRPSSSTTSKPIWTAPFSDCRKRCAAGKPAG